MSSIERGRRRGLRKANKAVSTLVSEANRLTGKYAAVSRDPARVVSLVRGLRMPLSLVHDGLAELEEEAALARPFHQSRRRLVFYVQMLFLAVGSADRAMARLVVVEGGRRSPLQSLHDPLGALTDSIGRLNGPPTKFQMQLGRLMERCDLTAYALGQEADVDATYIRRLLSGEMTKPSREVVSALGTAFKARSDAISDKDVARLLKSAGHTPRRLRRRFIGLF